MYIVLDLIKIENFEQGIAGKSKETRRDRWGGKTQIPILKC